MSTPYLLECGASLRAPRYDHANPPHGEITWYDTDTTAVSTSGPALTVSFDLSVHRAAGQERVAVVRLHDQEQYLQTERTDYQDPDGLLAVSATLRVDGRGMAENVLVVLPYAVFPEDVGGTFTVELAVHDPGGGLDALAWFEVDLPDDLQRSPDVLTVMAHTLVALSRATGSLTREDVRVIRGMLVEHFELDDLGDHALRRILKVANRADHDPAELARALRWAVPASDRELFVEMLYDSCAVDGRVPGDARAFIEDLLGRLGFHDHVRFGAERLRPHYEVLELEPGASLAEVKRAWRRLVRDYHPDRVQHLAVGFREFAHARVKELNHAYAELKEALE